MLNVNHTDVIPSDKTRPRAAEFFAGMGLTRRGLEQEGFEVVWANDIDRTKHALYAANFATSHFVLEDVRSIRGADLPDIELAAASFPCTDVSLAGNRAGLAGQHSGMFWEFARIIEEMGERRPPAVMLENVVGLATSRKGEDLNAALADLNRLGYSCDIFALDARSFVPQSRVRVFIVASLGILKDPGDWQPSPLRPVWISRFVATHPHLRLQALPLPTPIHTGKTLKDVVDHLASADPMWWSDDRLELFLASLSPIQQSRAAALRASPEVTYATAYRRTRNGKAVWEIRSDSISGCLRTARGGSSKQALIEAGRGELHIRWMSPREYARLQGAPDLKLDNVRPNQALFGLGDAVCVDVVAWIAREYLMPLLEGKLTDA